MVMQDQLTKLHLGCGYKKLSGFVNVDSDPLVGPDIIWDLEKFPWPFEDNSVDFFVAEHVLEHLGERTENWFGIWKELYRIAKPNAEMEIVVPHPRHDTFLVDPTHVRPIFPETIAMFDQIRNISDHQNGGRESKLGLSTGIDLEVTDVHYELTEPWKSLVENQRISPQEITDRIILMNNICIEIKMKVRFNKPARGLEWIRKQMQLTESR